MEQILHANPIKEDRKPTNTPFIIVLGLIFLVWLGNGIKAIIDSSTETVELLEEAVGIAEKNEDQTETQRLSGLYIIEGITLEFTWSYVVCTIISGLIAIFYVYFLSSSKSKFITEGAVYLLCIWMICILVLNSILSILLVENPMVHSGFLLSFMYTAYIIVSFRCARNVGTKAIFVIIKDSCGALCGCFVIPLFLCAICIIIALITSFTVYINYCILSSFFNSNIQTIRILSFLNIACGMTLIMFFVNFIHMVISGYVIDWYWMKDQQLNSMTFIKRSIMRTLRYHLGTLAFSSIPFLSYICSLFHTCRPRNSDNDITKIYNVFTRFCGQMCTFFYIVDFALIQTSVNGYDYTTAIAEAHDLVAQNNHELNIAVCEVSLIVARIGYVLMVIPFVYDTLKSAMYSMIIPFSIAFTSAVHASLVNKMIIDRASETLQRGHESAMTEFAKIEPVETETQLSVY